MSGRLRRIAIDVTPLRVSHDFRLLWTGSLISALGSQFVRVGLYIQVYALTASPAQVGLLGVSALVGNVAGTFVGGSFIDAHDRRLVLVWTQVGHIGVSGWLVAAGADGSCEATDNVLAGTGRFPQARPAGAARRPRVDEPATARRREQPQRGRV